MFPVPYFPMRQLKLRGSNNFPALPNVRDRAETRIQAFGLDPTWGYKQGCSSGLPRGSHSPDHNEFSCGPIQRVALRLSEAMHAKCLEQCLGHRKCSFLLSSV